MSGLSVLRGTVSSSPIWATRSQTSTQRYNKLIGAAGRYDAVVIGGGMFGITSALLLKLAGKRVALIEARSVGQNTTSSSTAKATSQQNIIYSTLRKMHGIETARKYGQMQEEAMNELESIVRRFNVNCDLRRVPHYTWTSEAKRVSDIKNEYDTALECNLPAEYIDGSPEDMPASVEAKAAVRFRDQIAYNPFDYCRALLQHIDGDGSKVFEHSRVTAVSDSSVHEIKTAEGSIEADNVILATHLPIMDRSGHFAMLPGSRSHCVVVKLRRPVLREMCVSADTPMRSLRIVDSEGLILVVAGESIEIGDETDTLKRYAALEDWARKHFPVESVVSKYSAMDYISGDHLPWIGRMYSGSDSIYTATGFSKWGLASGVAGAMICRDLIMGTSNKYADMVDARRWTIKAAPSFIQENIHTCKHFVSDYVKSLVAPNIDTLKVGEGGLVKAPGHTLAVGAYLDEQNQYHIVKPICTHLGCHLVWNNGDKVWDCPCHGSQFDVDGEVIHGPACTNLSVCKDLEQLKNLQW